MPVNPRKWIKEKQARLSSTVEESNDDLLIRLALKNKAILLTRDCELAQKASNYVKCALVPDVTLEHQVAFVVKTFHLNIKCTRTSGKCPACGSPIKRAPKTSIRERVFPRVYACNERFWQCTNHDCEAVYWRGTHWAKMVETAARIGAAISGALATNKKSYREKRLVADENKTQPVALSPEAQQRRQAIAERLRRLGLKIK